MRMLPVLLIATLVAACSATPPTAAPAESASRMDGIARRYVALVLELGTHDEGYVDAYYGPAA